MPKRPFFENRFVFIQPVPIHRIGFLEGEVTDTEGDYILEEMGTLTGVDVDIGHRRFDYSLRSTDLIPTNRDAKRWVGGTPTTWADQQIGAVLAR